MSDLPELPGNAGEKNVVPDAGISGRRRFIQAGITATPVIMTVLSGPVLANGVGIDCQSPSAFGSINTSDTGGGATCNGLSHGYWKNTDQHPWPDPYNPTDSFNTVFPPGGYPGKTLLEVLSNGGGAPYDDIARDIVGALLNAQSGLNPSSVMTVALIKDIWNQYRGTGHWSNGTLYWTHDEIAAWLQSTYI